MKNLFIINTLFEAGAGVLFVSVPGAADLFVPINQSSIYLLRMYGFAILAIAWFSWYLTRQNNFQILAPSALLFFAIFHSGITLAQVLSPLGLYLMLPPLLVHLVLAVAFWRNYYLLSIENQS